MSMKEQEPNEVVIQASDVTLRVQMWTPKPDMGHGKVHDQGVRRREEVILSLFIMKTESEVCLSCLLWVDKATHFDFSSRFTLSELFIMNR